LGLNGDLHLEEFNNFYISLFENYFFINFQSKTFRISYNINKLTSLIYQLLLIFSLKGKVAFLNFNAGFSMNRHETKPNRIESSSVKKKISVLCKNPL
jgi:hypothetical protein